MVDIADGCCGNGLQSATEFRSAWNDWHAAQSRRLARSVSQQRSGATRRWRPSTRIRPAAVRSQRATGFTIRIAIAQSNAVQSQQCGPAATASPVSTRILKLLVTFGTGSVSDRFGQSLAITESRELILHFKAALFRELDSLRCADRPWLGKKNGCWSPSSAAIFESSSPGRARTSDTRINSPLLYRLSYRGIDKL